MTTASPRLWVCLWLALLMVTGTYLRIHGVDDYYYSLDELAHVSIAQGTTLSEVNSYSKFETHPPLPHILRHYAVPENAGVAAMRGFSVLFGIGCILLYYALGKQAGGTLAGCAAAYLVTFGYGNIQQSQIVRNYTLLAFFLGVAFYCYSGSMTQQRMRYMAGYAVAGLLALATHYSAIFALGCMGLGGTVRLWREGTDARRALYTWLAANALIVLCFACMYMLLMHDNPYALQFEQNAEFSALVPPYNTLSYRLELFAAYPAAVASYFLHSSYAAQLNALSMILLLLALWLCAKRSKPLFYESLLALAAGGLLLALNLYPYAFHIAGRHAMWVMPYVMLPVSLLAAYGLEKIRQNKAIIAALGVGLLALGIGINSQGDMFRDKREYQLTRAEHNALDEFLKHLPKSDVIVTHGLNALYLLPPDTSYYHILASTSRQSDYYTGNATGGTRLFFYLPVNNRSFNLRDMLLKLRQNGTLKGAQTVWFFGTLYNTSLWRSTECHAVAKTAFSIPAEDTLAQGEEATAALYGIDTALLFQEVVDDTGRYSDCRMKLSTEK